MYSDQRTPAKWRRPALPWTSAGHILGVSSGNDHLAAGRLNVVTAEVGRKTYLKKHSFAAYSHCICILGKILPKVN